MPWNHSAALFFAAALNAQCPVLEQTVPTSLPNVVDGRFTITGRNLGSVRRVEFGTSPITSRSRDDWHAGYFTVVGPQEIHLFPPQGLTTGPRSLAVTDGSCTSNALTVHLVEPTTPALRVPPRLTAGVGLHVFAHRASAPAAASHVFLVFSPVLEPSILPGIVTLSIGGNFSSLVVLPMVTTFDPVTRVAHFGPFRTPPTYAGGEIHVQALLIDPSDPWRVPILTTDAWCTYF
jgi:hypothetical protein